MLQFERFFPPQSRMLFRHCCRFLATVSNEISSYRQSRNKLNTFNLLRRSDEYLTLKYPLAAALSIGVMAWPGGGNIVGLLNEATVCQAQLVRTCVTSHCIPLILYPQRDVK